MAQIPGYEDKPFDANEVDPAGTYEPIPAGWYEASIISSEVKETKAGNGEYLSLTFSISENESEFSGRMVWCNLNLVNPNPKAVEIARRELSSLCHAVDVLNPEDSSELHGIPLQIKVKVRPATDNYPAANDVVGFRSLDSGEDVPW